MSDPTPSPETAKGALTANKRSPAQKAADALFIERLHLRGKTTREIAELLSKERDYTLSHQQVALDLKKIGQLWQQEATKLCGHEKEKALRKLDILEAECWEAWDKSKQAKTRTTLTKKSKGAKGDPAAGTAAAASPGEDIKSAVSVTSPGDPAFVGKILEILDRRAKLLGLDAPTKSEFSGPGGGPIPVAATDVVLSEEDHDAVLQRHFERMQRKRQQSAGDTDAGSSEAPETPTPA